MTCPMRYPEACETPIACGEMGDCAIQDARLREKRASDDCLCITRVSWDGALIVIADSECDRHRPAIVDVQS